MSPSEPSSADRERHALIAWFLRRDEAGWTTKDEADFQDWLARPGHHAAYARWEADWRAIDALPTRAVERLQAQVAAERQVRVRPLPPPSPRSERRRQTAGLALVGVAALATAGGWAAWQRLDRAHQFSASLSTARGLQRDEVLPDGSWLRLDAATALSVRFESGLRQVQLHEGLAGFEVKGDPLRPFEVQAGPIRVRVVGTRFMVRLTPEVPGREGVEVAVAEGRVRVARSTGNGMSPETAELGAGQALVFTVDGRPPRLLQVKPEAVLAWRGAPLSFSDVPLRQALAEMARHADLGIVRVDPAVADLRLTGTFDPRNVAATRRLLLGALPIRLVDTPRGSELRALR